MTLQRQLANLSSTSIGAAAVGEKWAEMGDDHGRDVRQQQLDMI